MRRPVVPRRELAAIEADAIKWRGNYEKVATTPIREMEVKGVSITSRYNKADEFDTMAGMVRGVDEHLRPLIKSIFCDSKACSTYSIELERCSHREARAIADQLDQDCCKHDGGHNGIHVEGANGGRLNVNPRWTD